MHTEKLIEKLTEHLVTFKTKAKTIIEENSDNYEDAYNNSLKIMSWLTVEFFSSSLSFIEDEDKKSYILNICETALQGAERLDKKVQKIMEKLENE